MPISKYVYPPIPFTIVFDNSEQADDVTGCLEAIADVEGLSIADVIEKITIFYIDAHSVEA
jgi:hypothetical protein